MHGSIDINIDMNIDIDAIDREIEIYIHTLGNCYTHIAAPQKKQSSKTTSILMSNFCS